MSVRLLSAKVIRHLGLCLQVVAMVVGGEDDGKDGCRGTAMGTTQGSGPGVYVLHVYWPLWAIEVGIGLDGGGC